MFKHLSMRLKIMSNLNFPKGINLNHRQLLGVNFMLAFGLWIRINIRHIFWIFGIIWIQKCQPLGIMAAILALDLDIFRSEIEFILECISPGDFTFQTEFVQLVDHFFFYLVQRGKEVWMCVVYEQLVDYSVCLQVFYYEILFAVF